MARVNTSVSIGVADRLYFILLTFSCVPSVPFFFFFWMRLAWCSDATAINFCFILLSNGTMRSASELLVRYVFADSIRFVFLLVYSVVLNETRDALALCHLYSFSLFVAF